MEDTPVRLSKLMAERGLCSRREADGLIAKGWVKVDGVTVSVLGTKVSPHAKIELSRQAQKIIDEAATILLNKPVGYVSGQPEDDYEPAVRLITADNQDSGQKNRPLKKSHLEKLAPAGRLDIDSQGLLVFTQDGRVAKLLIGENSPIEKEYLVRFSGKITRDILNRLCYGLELDGKPLKPAQVKQINPDQLQFILHEGRKRQIRRMCELVGLEVRGLKRVRIGRIRLGRLPEGKWRFLEPTERF